MLKGTVFQYGDNIDTDVIIPARYLSSADPKTLAEHCMEDIDPPFASQVKEGDMIVGGNNFGCGSSREHAPLAIKSCGVSCVIAKSFARIFYRNAINIGLPILECAEADEIKTGHVVEVNLEKGEVHDKTLGKTFICQPFPPFITSIIKAGGLINAIKNNQF